MSRASERRAMTEAIAGYALMGVPELAALLGCSPDVAHGMIEEGLIPSVTVGARKKIDPVDAGVYVLAGREGCEPPEYWERYGEGQVVENVRRYFRHAARVKNVDTDPQAA